MSTRSTSARSATNEELIFIKALEILGFEVNDPLVQALTQQKYDLIVDIICIPEDEIDTLQYHPPTPDDPSDATSTTGAPDPVTPSTGHKTKLKKFQRWIQVQQEKYNGVEADTPMPIEHWNTFTRSQFDAWRISPRSSGPLRPLPNTERATPPPAAAIQNWERGNRRDLKEYPILKSTTGTTTVPNFDMELRNIMKLHSLTEILDQNYVPQNQIDKDLFRLKCSYAFSVFLRSFQFDVGKEIVRKYQHDEFSAQLIYRDFSKWMRTSAEAKIRQSELLSKIVNSRLDASWNGTICGYIRGWHEMLRNYNDNCLNETERWTSIQSKSMLKAALSTHAQLDQTDQLELANNTDMDYIKYRELCLNMGSKIDNRNKSTTKTRTSINNHSHATSTDISYLDDFDQHVYIENNDTIDINAHNQTNRFDRTKKNNHDRNRHNSNNNSSSNKPNAPNIPVLPPTMWKKIPTEVQEFIRQKCNRFPTSDAREVHFQAIIPQTETDATVPDISDDVLGTDNTDDISPQGTVNFLIESSNPQPPPRHNNAHHSQFYSNMHKMHIDSPSTNQSIDHNDSMDVDTTCTSTTEYIISAQASTATGHGRCLVDRGSNGGLAGDDVLVLEHCADRNVDVTGIGNNKLTNLSIGTVLGLTKSHVGPILVELPQMAIYGKGKTILSSIQLEQFMNKVEDQSRLAPHGGNQCITTVEDYVIPLSIQDGLCYMPITKPSMSDIDKYPLVTLQSDLPWNPSFADNNIDEGDNWFQDRISEVGDNPGGEKYGDINFDAHGNYRHRVHAQEQQLTPLQNYSTPTIDTTPTAFQTPTRPPTYCQALKSSATPTTPNTNVARRLFRIHASYMQESSPYDPHSRAYCFNHRIETAVTNIADYIELNNHKIDVNKPDFSILRPFFLGRSTQLIEATFKCSTQYGRSIDVTYPMRNHKKSRFPAANVPRRNETISGDWILTDIKAAFGGEPLGMIFSGTKSKVRDFFPLHHRKQFVNAFEDVIRKRGAPTRLMSDFAKEIMSNKVVDLCRNYFIQNYQSEPYHEHQNPVERDIQDVMRFTNWVLDNTDAPLDLWVLIIQYVCYIFNRMAHPALDWQSPLQHLTGNTQDISIMLKFRFYEPVYYMAGYKASYATKPSFPSETIEARGKFVGFGETVGDALTFMILTDKTNELIYRSNVRTALTPEECRTWNQRFTNVRADNDVKRDNHGNMTISGNTPSVGDDKINDITNDGEIEDENRHSENPRKLTNIDKEGNESRPKFVIRPENIVGKTWISDEDGDGEKRRATVTQLLTKYHSDLEKHPARIKFLVTYDGTDLEEIKTYVEMMDIIANESDNDTDKLWTFKDIVAHEGPLNKNHPSYKGSSYNVKMLWEDGSETFEPLDGIAKDSPVVCAIYAERAGLLDTTGWKRFKKIAKNEKKMQRLLNQAKLRSYRRTNKYKFGYIVAMDHKDAMHLDAKSGTKRWTNAEATEMESLVVDFSTFQDLGKDSSKLPSGYKKIRVHFVYDVKHDGRHKARLVADGHLTDIPLESVYSGVVSIRSLRIVIFISELNNMICYAADVGNAYLTSFTSEKVYIIGPPGFGELEGHILIIIKALYGLKSSGKRYREKFSDTLNDMGFRPTKADEDVWMRRNKDMYEYIAVYVDDLAIVAKDPEEIIRQLREVYDYTLKGVGPLKYHLGCNFDRDPDGTLYMSPRTYISKLMVEYERLFNEKPRFYKCPLVDGDHPELDTSELLDEEGVKIYQSMIGSLQWIVTLGRFDIQTAVMTLSSFRVAPRQGHLDRAKRVYGYLRKFQEAGIRFRTGIPNYDNVNVPKYDWAYTTYGKCSEDIPADAPVPLGNPVTSTHYFDASLYHCWLSGKAVSGIIHFINGFVVDTFSKKQNTVETSTYGAEFVAARICVDQIVDLRTTLRYLGVPIIGPAYTFGDNRSMVDSATLPDSRLNKRHTALSFHRVRHSVAAEFVVLNHIAGKWNPSDICSKHCGYGVAWPHIRPMFFWAGSKPCPIFAKQVSTMGSDKISSVHNEVNNDKVVSSLTKEVSKKINSNKVSFRGVKEIISNKMSSVMKRINASQNSHRSRSTILNHSDTYVRKSIGDSADNECQMMASHLSSFSTSQNVRCRILFNRETPEVGKKLANKNDRNIQPMDEKEEETRCCCNQQCKFNKADVVAELAVYLYVGFYIYMVQHYHDVDRKKMLALLLMCTILREWYKAFQKG